jgi:hypothetical protein
MYGDAIENYSKAIERQLANLTFLLNLKQIRGLYPEYDNVPDEILGRKIRDLFWPEYEYSVIEEKLLAGEGQWQIGSVITNLYERRGDAYLKANDFRRGVLDFTRIFKGIPNFADVEDRWRELGSSSGGGAYYLDVKSVEFAHEGPARLWLKTANKDKSYTVQSWDIECKSRRLSVTATAFYNSDDQLVRSLDVNGGWQRVIPETRGEQLYNGACH